jgi:hypothetical protein
MRKTLIAVLTTVTLLLSFALLSDSKSKEFDKTDFVWVGDGYQLFMVTGKTARQLAAECKCSLLVNTELKTIFILELPLERQT